MVSVLPETTSVNGLLSWFIYGMLATASFAVVNALVGSDIENAVKKGA